MAKQPACSSPWPPRGPGNRRKASSPGKQLCGTEWGSGPVLLEDISAAAGSYSQPCASSLRLVPSSNCLARPSRSLTICPAILSARALSLSQLLPTPHSHQVISPDTRPNWAPLSQHTAHRRVHAELCAWNASGPSPPGRLLFSLPSQKQGFLSEALPTFRILFELTRPSWAHVL